MSQSRTMSAVETFAQMTVGQLVACVIWLYGLAPIAAPHLATWADAVAVNFPFLLASLARGYMVRRVFVWFDRG